MKLIENLSTFDWYLIIVNIVGFVAYLINMILYKYTANGQIDAVLTILSLMGGSAGIVLAILLFDRKSVKENMMSRVFVISVLVVQIVIFLVIKGHHADKMTLAFWTFFNQHKIILIYLAIINVVTFVVYAVDKHLAIEGKQRIRIITLLGLAFIGGSIGGLLAMYLFRHKTQKDYFTVGVPLIIIMQIVVLIYSMNAGW